MTLEIPVQRYAIAGPGAEFLEDDSRVALPPPGTRRRGGRLPLLATELAQRVEYWKERDDASVILGTGLGCLTETQLFVEHMIDAEEATPKPRAFASSVHNAIASKVALVLEAKGECHTLSCAEASFSHAVFAACMVRRRARGPIYLGAVDETCAYVDRGLAACNRDNVKVTEGGAMLCAGGDHGIARLLPLAWGRRPLNLEAWVAVHVEKGPIVTVPALDGTHLDVPGANRAPFESFHASLTATAVALAVGIVTEDVSYEALGLPDKSPCINIVTQSRLGDCSIIEVLC